MSTQFSPKAMLAEYLKAEQAVLAGKTITFQGRSMGMENLSEIRTGRREWEQRVAQENRRTGGRPSIGGMSFSVARFGD
ncbi:hypothetical protein LK540_17315 [Massilia sp. IC2-278]|uniref:hypothetical protein n=1 Tax=Massilia sp. IC2-278 TaxID=2887200 RepID=UPI001E4CC492|nr:hypothetical protein [Massilia sp. IC2-278]MCC2962189.1 hypothetical protein [Massilia sp. IC2-278]